MTPGTQLPHEYTSENLELLKKGVCNMQHHIKNCRKFGVKVVVAVNQFASDTEAELQFVRQAALDAGAFGFFFPPSLSLSFSLFFSLLSLFLSHLSFPQ